MRLTFVFWLNLVHSSLESVFGDTTVELLVLHKLEFQSEKPLKISDILPCLIKIYMMHPVGLCNTADCVHTVSLCHTDDCVHTVSLCHTDHCAHTATKHFDSHHCLQQIKASVVTCSFKPWPGKLTDFVMLICKLLKFSFQLRFLFFSLSLCLCLSFSFKKRANFVYCSC